jgi:hypothetical protein
MRNRFACANTSSQTIGIPAQYSGLNEACSAKIRSNIEKNVYCAYCNIPIIRYSIRFMRSISDIVKTVKISNFILTCGTFCLYVNNRFLNISFVVIFSEKYISYMSYTVTNFLQCAPFLCIFRLIQRTRQWIFSFLWAVFALLCIQLIFYMDK